MADLSQVKIGSTTYNLKDSTARADIAALSQTVAGGVSFIISSNAANTPKDIVWNNGTSNITGTLTADNATAGAFYLVASGKSAAGDADVYDEYVPVGSTGSKTWEKIGNTRVDFTSISLNKQTDVVLGEATTFTMPSRSVSFAAHTTDKALGEATTFTNASSTVTLGTPSTDTFIKSYSGATSKLVTTSITGTNGTVTAAGAPTVSQQTIPVTTISSQKSIPNVTGVGTLPSYTVSGEVLELTTGTLPTLGTAISATYVTAGTSISATYVTFASNVTAAKAASSATTVATGSVSASGSGSSVMTGLGTSSSGTAVTALPSTGNSAAAQTITVGTNDKISAITALGAATAASGSVTVGTNDKVTVLTNSTSISTS